MELSSGDRVVYPNQGVCRVTAVEEKEVAGQKLVFVSMQREEDGARVMVPKQKLVSIGVRKISSLDDTTKIFDFLRADTEKADLDWKVRARTNLDRMSGGGLMGMAEVVKGLQILSELRPLPTKERELYDTARHLLVTELSVALSIPEKNAEDAVDLALFPPGKERPKRTAEEFARPGEEDEDLDLGEDVLGLDGGELGLPDDSDASSNADSGPDDSSAEASDDEGEKVAAKKPAKAVLSDDDVTHAMGTALSPEDEAPIKKKRGRPPKPKPPAPAEPAAPKKRGRPPKPKPPVDPDAPPKKRGRPPKSEAAKKKK